MKAKLIKTDGPGLEAIIEIDNRQYGVMDDFGWSAEHSPGIGHTFEVELSAMLDDTWSWEQIFGANPDRRVGLEPLGGWSYLAFGRITSVDPVRVDCGIYVEERAVFTHDVRVVGEFVGFRIERLDATAG